MSKEPIANLASNSRNTTGQAVGVAAATHTTDTALEALAPGVKTPVGRTPVGRTPVGRTPVGEAARGLSPPTTHHFCLHHGTCSSVQPRQSGQNPSVPPARAGVQWWPKSGCRWKRDQRRQTESLMHSEPRVRRLRTLGRPSPGRVQGSRCHLGANLYDHRHPTCVSCCILALQRYPNGQEMGSKELPMVRLVVDCVSLDSRRRRIGRSCKC